MLRPDSQFSLKRERENEKSGFFIRENTPKKENALRQLQADEKEKTSVYNLTGCGGWVSQIVYG